MLLIDGDILVYKASASSTLWKAGMRLFSSKYHALTRLLPEEFEQLKSRITQPSIDDVKDCLNALILKIKNGVKTHTDDTFVAGIAHTYLVILSPSDGVNNFRHTIARTQPYKGNRKDLIRPLHFDLAREHLIEEHKAHVTYGQEADDALGISQCQELGTVICSTDKDLKTVPGWNYNWDKKALTYITTWDAEYNFYYQILCGDVADNIPGVWKIGPIGANKLLSPCHTPKEMLETVITTCMQKHNKSREEAEEYINEIGALLRIRREPDEIWSIYSVTQIVTHTLKEVEDVKG